MSMSGFQVDPEALRASAESLDRSVDRMAEVLEQFESTVQGLGEPWGGDDLGALIGELYLGIHDLAMSCFEGNGEVLGQFAAGLHTMADAFEEADQQVEAGLRKIGQALGG
ncbi:WXG100 family type VII secretion target [Micromonospora echinaurantiaca]|uniref:WXG100 family type VII secretion target n=1 Tax=Micromonospora echinaurantiaca TaxID=47857 RepID=UPI0037117C6A